MADNQPGRPPPPPPPPPPPDLDAAPPAPTRRADRSGIGEFASWPQRLGSTLIDGLVMIVPAFAADSLATHAGGRAVGGIAVLVIQFVYETLMLARWGQTLGNRTTATAVQEATARGLPALRRSAARAALPVLFELGPLSNRPAIGGAAFLLALLDVLWPLWDPRNQTLHDKLAGTVVIRTQ